MANEAADKVGGGVIVSVLERDPLDWQEFRARGRILGIDTAWRSSSGPGGLAYNAEFSSEEEFSDHAKGAAPEMLRMYPSAGLVDVAFYPSDQSFPAWTKTFRRTEA